MPLIFLPGAGSRPANRGTGTRPSGERVWTYPNQGLIFPSG